MSTGSADVGRAVGGDRGGDIGGDLAGLAAAQLRTLLDLSNARISEYENAMAKIREHNELLIRELAMKATSGNDKYESMQITLNKKIRSLEEDVQARDQTIDELRTEICERDKKLASLVAELEDSKQMLQNTREELTSENAKLRTKTEHSLQRMKRDAVEFQKKLEKTYRERMDEITLKHAQEAYIRRSFENN